MLKVFIEQEANTRKGLPAKMRQSSTTNLMKSVKADVPKADVNVDDRSNNLTV